MQVVRNKGSSGESASQSATENLYIDDRLEAGAWVRKKENSGKKHYYGKMGIEESKLHGFIIGRRKKPTTERPLEWACHQFVDVLISLISISLFLLIVPFLTLNLQWCTPPVVLGSMPLSASFRFFLMTWVRGIAFRKLVCGLGYDFFTTRVHLYHYLYILSLEQSRELMY